MKVENKLKVLTEFRSGAIKASEAAHLMRRSERTIYRWQRRCEDYGMDSVLIHASCGRPSPHRIPADVRRQVLELVVETYANTNDTHLRELLAKNHGIKLGRETVRGLLRAHGVSPKQRRRSPKWRQRRQRKSQMGMMLQIDASLHDWLQGRGPQMTLIGGIDDATGHVFAVFEDVECTYGYFNLLRAIIASHGVPLGLYSDRHTIFYCLKEPTLQEQLSNHIPLTQFGRAVKELGIGMTKAYSPQAKGRIERLWRTLQDRLIVEMRLAGICSKDEANEFLKTYLPQFNAQFGKTPAQKGTCFRRRPSNHFLDQILCLKETRKVNRDHTVSYNGRILQIPKKKGLRSLSGREVEIWEYQNGTIKIAYKNLLLATYQPLAQEVILGSAA